MENSKEYTPKGEQEIREAIIKEYDLDPEDDTNKPFIEKAVKKELDWENKQVEFSKKEIEHEKKLSKAIEQKIKIREQLKAVGTDDDEPKPDLKPKEDVVVETPKDNEKLTALEQKVAEMEQKALRSQYSHLEDEEFNAINNLAKAEGKSFEDTMSNNPLAKTYLETNKVSERIASATANPSNRTNPNTHLTPEQIDLGNPDHVKYLKEDPKRVEEYESWMDKGGSKILAN